MVRNYFTNSSMIYLGIYCIYHWFHVYDGLVSEISILISLQHKQQLSKGTKSGGGNWS